METQYAFTNKMNEKLPNAFDGQSFTNLSAFLGKNYYNPEDTILHHIPIKEKRGKVERIRLRYGTIKNTLTGVDNQEIVEIAGKTTEISEGVL